MCMFWEMLGVFWVLLLLLRVELEFDGELKIVEVVELEIGKRAWEAESREYGRVGLDAVEEEMDVMEEEVKWPCVVESDVLNDWPLLAKVPFIGVA